MKRAVTFVLSLVLILSSTNQVFSASLTESSAKPSKIYICNKPDVSVELNGIAVSFKDTSGNALYPIIYDGATYLPIRAISDLMKEPVEWDGGCKTVFIGKTLSNPNKSKTDPSISTVTIKDGTDNTRSIVRPEFAPAYLKPDIMVMYDFVIRSFQDEEGDPVYPIVYKGSAYLPVRAISQLMKEPILWDAARKTVCIGDGEETIDNTIPAKSKEKSLETKCLTGLFEKEEILYYEATAKTTSLSSKVKLEEKQQIAAAVSENYRSAQNLSAEILELDTTKFNAKQQEACQKIKEFAESTEYYILILENIAYLAASDSDYSMLAETFLNFAMDSQTKMEEARTLLQTLE